MSGTWPVKERLDVTDVVIRMAAPEDAPALDVLIREHQAEGHLLPRDVAEIRSRAHRFVVCESGGQIKACAELAPLSPKAAEVRSLVVAGDVRRMGIATRLIDHLKERARAGGFSMLTAFAHDPHLFIAQNFSIVPHVWLPEKLAKDCRTCPLFRRCGQYAMVLSLVEVPRVVSPPAPGRRPAAMAVA
jgi:amino-acid N-acetyltransferase